MKLIVKKASTSKIIHIFILDVERSDGYGLTGLAYNTASLTAYYIREGAASATAITLATATVGTWTSGGFKEVDATNMPGIYELGIPDACLASGADSVVIFIKDAVDMAPVPIEIQLVDNTEKDIYDRIGAPAGASISADLLVIDNYVDEIENALGPFATGSCAGDLSLLSSDLNVVDTNVDTLIARLTAVRAGYIDNLSAGAVALEATLTAIKGATFAGATDSLEAIRDRGDAAWATATGFSVPNEYDAVIAALQTDLDNPNQYKANVSNLDVAVSTRAPANEYDIQMGYIPANLGDVPTDTELNTAHGDGNWEGTTPADVADAVWNELKALHMIAGSFGEEIDKHGKKLDRNFLGLI